MKSESSQTPAKPRNIHWQARSKGINPILQLAGVDGDSANAIARYAGVSIGSIYQYFPTRSAITYEVIRRNNAKLAQEISALGS
jgi:hypothetical protein